VEKKNVNFGLLGNFDLVEFHGVLITIISMNAKAMDFDVFHVHIAQDVVTGIGHYPKLTQRFMLAS